MSNPLLDSPGTRRAGHLNNKLKLEFLFLMKEIKGVQTNLVGLDNRLPNTPRARHLKLVNSMDKRGFPYSNIKGLAYTYTKKRERESPFKPNPAAASAGRRKAVLTPF